VARTRKDGHAHAKDDEEETLLLDRKPSSLKSPSKSQVKIFEDEPASTPKKATRPRADDSDTEEESDDEELILDKAPQKNGQPLPTPARSISPETSGGREPGRIIGIDYPLKEFKKNISQGDLVTKAVEDLGYVIGEIVSKPFAHKRHEEMIECMKAMRDTSVKEDEVEAWNA
jgi:ATP-dependent DNA helicase 2 subunit 2